MQKIGMTLAAIVAAAGMAAASGAQAGVAAEILPFGHYVGSYTDLNTDQNFLAPIHLATATNLTGMAIWGYPGSQAVGQNVKIRIRSDDGGAPDATDLAFILTQLNTASPDATVPHDGLGDPLLYLKADFTQTLAAGDYWIGMIGVGTVQSGLDIAWSSFSNGGPDGANYRLSVDTAEFPAQGIGTFAYQVFDDTIGVAPIPEPASWALMIGGFGLAGGALRRRRGLTAA